MELYSRGSIIVQTILIGIQFDSTKDSLMGKTVFRTSATKEHVAEIERWILNVKERGRAMESNLPFDWLHKLIVVNLLYFFILWMHAFPVKDGVSQEFSPRYMVVCTKLSWKHNCSIKFGEYAEVHDDPDWEVHFKREI